MEETTVEETTVEEMMVEVSNEVLEVTEETADEIVLGTPDEDGVRVEGIEETTVEKTKVDVSNEELDNSLV